MGGPQGRNPTLCQVHVNTQTSASEGRRRSGRDGFSKESQRLLWGICTLCEDVLL